MAGLKVKIGADASQFERTMRGVQRQVGGVKSSIRGIAGAVGAVWAVNKAFDALRSTAALVGKELRAASDVASDVEMMETQFAVLTDSQEKAASLMATFRKEAQKSSLTLDDWAKSARTLLAFGTDASDVTGAMKMLGDVSMGNSEQFRNMTLAYAQVSAAGRLMGQEVRQMVNAGFNPLQQISKRTGESMLELKKRMEEGLIPFSEVEQAFVDATSEGGRFYRAIDKGSDTFAGKMNKAKDAVFGLRLSFGEGFNKGLKDVLDATSEFLPQFESKLAEAGNTIGTAISEAVQGDETRLVAIGQYIGSFIAEGIERTAAKTLRAIIRQAEAVATLGITEALRFAGAEDPSFGRLVSTGDEIGQRYQQGRAALGGALRPDIKESLETREINGQLWRYQSPNAPNPSPFTDENGRRMVLLQERVVELLTPQPSN